MIVMFPLGSTRVDCTFYCSNNIFLVTVSSRIIALVDFILVFLCVYCRPISIIDGDGKDMEADGSKSGGKRGSNRG